MSSKSIQSEKHLRNEDKGGGPRRRKALSFLLPLILLLIAAVAAAAAWSYKSTLDSLSVTFTDDSPELDFGGSYSAMDLVKSSEGDVEPAAESLDTSRAGSGRMMYSVSKSLFGGLLTPYKRFRLDYTVVDKEPPVMLQSGDGAVVIRGQEFDIDEVIAYGDNADPEPELKISGNVDTGKTGTYPLHVKVTDASGNKTEWDLSVEVSDDYPPLPASPDHIMFGDFASANKGDGRSFGIDVSAWQGDIDFDAVKAAGCSFVMIRIGYSEDGEITFDNRFEKNYKNARAAGLKIGLYMYSHDSTAEEARSSASKIAEKLGGDTLDLPVAFDWEDFAHFQTYKMSFAGLNGLYDAFSDELSKSGYDCLLYGSRNYLESIWEDTDTRPVWLAHYTDKTDYKGPYRMWQAACTGRIKGISGDVDLDILYE